MKRKKSGFTLIELIAVLVIMAILALIVTPLVLNIIRKARTAADKRSIDAYGRSIEIAIAGYLLDNGYFPTSIGQLTIEYSGDEVVCSTTQLNGDSSVYLTGCTVGGRNVDYTYGTDTSPSYTAYNVGTEVTYNGVDYRVIKNSGVKESTVTLLKAEPLSVQEVNTYGAGHVNMNVPSDVDCYQTACNDNGYGGMVYYSSSTCGYNGSNWVVDGCTNSYASSEIKYVVDAWKAAKAPAATETRLMTYDEYTDLSEVQQVCTGSCYEAIVPKYDWMYNNDYFYWLGTTYTDSASNVWDVGSDGSLHAGNVVYGTEAVRPVITLSKSLISA